MSLVSLAMTSLGLVHLLAAEAVETITWKNQTFSVDTSGWKSYQGASVSVRLGVDYPAVLLLVVSKWSSLARADQHGLPLSRLHSVWTETPWW